VGHDPDIADLGQVGLDVDSHVDLSELSELRSAMAQQALTSRRNYQR
jgi:hypothetical protein